MYLKKCICQTDPTIDRVHGSMVFLEQICHAGWLTSFKPCKCNKHQAEETCSYYFSSDLQGRERSRPASMVRQPLHWCPYWHIFDFYWLQESLIQFAKVKTYFSPCNQGRKTGLMEKHGRKPISMSRSKILFYDIVSIKDAHQLMHWCWIKSS